MTRPKSIFVLALVAFLLVAGSAGGASHGDLKRIVPASKILDRV